MLHIFVTRQSRYPADGKALKERVRKVLVDRGVTDVQVSIALVGARKMKDLAVKYLGEKEDDEVHEVLSFPYAESKNDFITPVESGLHLGDVVICYPEARKIAIKRNRMMDDVLGELAEHGTLHLLGIHHE